MEQIVSVADNVLVPEKLAAAYVRQVAVHANLAVLAHRNQNSTWLERLKQIETIRKRHAGSAGAAAAGPAMSTLGAGGGPSTSSMSSTTTAAPAGGSLLQSLSNSGGSSGNVLANMGGSTSLAAASFDFTRFL